MMGPSGEYLVCYACGLSRLAGGYSIPNSTSNSKECLDLETSSQARTPLCSPERKTGTPKIGFSDMMCDVGNAAIKDAIANIARNREVLHFLSCIARCLGHFSGLPTRTKPLARRTLPRMANPALLE